ncbi:MAG: DeoR/GlpR transcriptional regulator [Chloroflexi bacterium]|nr:DeoR/GlpR transcriptional regulator [Chloroflexota bacterium]
MLASERRQYILEKTQETGRVQINDLSQELGVSRMTVHRDLTGLAQEGLIRKVYGGATTTASPRVDDDACAMCSMRVRRRTAFILNCEDGSQIQACCPHCGLMLLTMRPEAISALTVDFLHGRMINVRTATYLVNSELTVCCTPSVLCFQFQDEAERFQRGFGGEVMDRAQAQAYLSTSMDIHRAHDEP